MAETDSNPVNHKGVKAWVWGGRGQCPAEAQGKRMGGQMWDQFRVIVQSSL